MANTVCFLGAAAGGFLFMHFIGVQVLISLLSSIPLAKRRHRENPGFDLNRAYRRIFCISVTGLVLVLLVSALVIRFTSNASTLGYLVGLILAVICSIKRMTPTSKKNQRSFEHVYGDCYPFPDDSEDEIPSPGGTEE